MVSAVKETRMKIFQYILTVAEIDEEKAQAIMQAGISTPGVLLRVNVQKLSELVTKDVITEIEFDELLRFRRFMVKVKDEGKELPNSLEQWETVLTTEAYSAFCDEDADKTKKGSYTLKEVNDLMKTVKVEEIMV